MDTQIKQIAQRIKGLREILDFKTQEMAEVLGISVADYEEYEKGTRDFSFTFLLKCANKFGVDIVEIISGENPRLSFYNIVRKNKGLPIKRREGFEYNHLAYLFKGKKLEPFLVTAYFSEKEQNEEIVLSTHIGQEFDYILEGQLKVRLEDHIEILNAGDSIYYDSGHGHGMIAYGGKDCKFLAIVMNKEEND